MAEGDYRTLPERDYSHRSVVDKLGIRPGDAVALAPASAEIDPALIEQVARRAGRPPAGPEERANAVLIAVDASIDAGSVLAEWRSRIDPAGGIWLLTPKRGRPGYINQNDLIPLGQAAGLVDNKTCSVSDETSAMRFVLRRRDRPSKVSAEE